MTGETPNPLYLIREALADAEHAQFGHDPMCRTSFADPGPCNCSVKRRADAHAALDQVADLAEAARAKRAHDHAKPVLLDHVTYQEWASVNLALGGAEDAALVPFAARENTND